MNDAALLMLDTNTKKSCHYLRLLNKTQKETGSSRNSLTLPNPNTRGADKGMTLEIPFNNNLSR
jgi:hypothetical protein